MWRTFLACVLLVAAAAAPALAGANERLAKLHPKHRRRTWVLGVSIALGVPFPAGAEMAEKDCQGLKALIVHSASDFQGRKGEPLKAIIGSHKRFRPIGDTTPLDTCAIVDSKVGRPDTYTSLDCEVAEWQWAKTAVTVTKEARASVVKAMQGLVSDFSSCLKGTPSHETMEAPDDTASTLQWWDWQVSVTKPPDQTTKPIPIRLTLTAYIPSTGAVHLGGNNRFRADIRIRRW